MACKLFVFLIFLVCGTRAVYSFENIIFGPIKQCGQFGVRFTGGKLPTALPLNLTIIPFNSSPISIPIDNLAWNGTTSTGAVVNFLPFVAGTTFIVSLDDANGKQTTPVSDVIKVQPSGDDSCIPFPPAKPPQFYSFVGPFSQCQPFKVFFNASLITRPPTVRAFTPRGKTFRMNTTFDVFGVAQYKMSSFRGTQVALVFDDGQGHTQTTNLITIGGDSTSDIKCLFPPKHSASPNSNHTGTSNEMNNSRSGGSHDALQQSFGGIGNLTKVGKITIGVISGTVVGGVAVAMALLLARKRSGYKDHLNVPSMSNTETKSWVLSSDIYLSTGPPSQIAHSIQSPTSERLKRYSRSIRNLRSVLPFPSEAAEPGPGVVTQSSPQPIDIEAPVITPPSRVVFALNRRPDRFPDAPISVASHFKSPSTSTSRRKNRSNSPPGSQGTWRSSIVNL